jgi:hypothetical protein
VEVRLTEPWRETLRSVDEELLLWTRAYRKRHGQARPVPLAASDLEEDGDADDAVEEWDAADDADVVTADGDA